MTKNKTLITSIALLMASTSVLAIPGRGRSGGGRATSTIPRPGGGGGTPGTVTGSSSGEECRPNRTELDGSHAISYDYLLAATDGDIPESEAISLEPTPPSNSHSYTIKMGKHVRACLEPRFDISQVGGNVFISVYNTTDFKSDRSLQPMIDASPDAWENTGNGDKYTKCLKEKGLLDAGGNIDWQVARDKGEISTSRTFPLNIDTSQIDTNTTVKLFFASAQLGDPHSTPAAPPNSVDADLKCRQYEDFGRNYIDNEGRTRTLELVVGEREQRLREFEALCSSGDVNAMRAQLEHYRSMGNALDLEEAMEAAIFSVMERNSEDYMRQMIGMIESAGDEELTNGQINRFRELSRKMVREILDPAATQLESLRERYNNAATDELKDELEARIEKFTELIDRSHISLDTLRPIYGQIRNRESKHPVALDIERMRGKSIVYRKINPLAYDSLTLEEANEKIDKVVGDFRNSELEDWRCHAQSARGEPACLKAAERDIKSRQARYGRARQRFASLQMRCRMANFQAQTRGINPFGASPVYESRKCQRELNKAGRLVDFEGRSTLAYMNQRGEQVSRYRAGYQSFLEYRALQEAERRSGRGDFQSFSLGSLDYFAGGGTFGDAYNFGITPQMPYMPDPSMGMIGMPPSSHFAPMPSPMAGPMMAPQIPPSQYPPPTMQYGGRQ